MPGADLHDLDWEDLRCFAAFAQHETLSAAARKLSVDHVTVSRRIAALEASLGVRLLDRRTRVASLTAEGERIAALALRMDDEAHGVLRVARGLAPDIAGEVSISAPPTLASALIAPRLGELRAKHPALRIRLIGEKRVASLSRREADVALRLVRPTEAGLVARKIGSCGFALYGASSYLAGRKAKDLELIAADDDSTLPQQRWLRTIARGRPVVLRTNDLESQLAAVRAGVGVAVLPDFLAERFGDLERVRVRGRPAVRDVWIVVHDDLRRAKAVRAVMDFLAEVVRR